MTLTTTTSKHILSGNGVTLVFQYQFPITSSAHLLVIHTDADNVDSTLVLDTDYTVAGVGNAAGGSITLTGSAPSAAETITLCRVVPIKQETDYSNQGGYYPDTAEGAMDTLTMIAQQQQEELDRCPKVGVTSSTDPDSFMDDIEDAAGNASAAAASALAAAASALEAAASATLAATNAADAKSQCISWITCSNVTDLVIKAGTEVDSDDGTMRMRVTSDITVSITDVGANGLDTGTETNGIYQIWLICAANGSDISGLLVLNADNQVAPTMPSGYTLKRCIGFVENLSGDFVPFHQAGDLHVSAGGHSIATSNPAASPSTTTYNLKTKCARQLTASALVRFRLVPHASGSQADIVIGGSELTVAELGAGAVLTSLTPTEIPLTGSSGDHGFSMSRGSDAWSTFNARIYGYRLKFPMLIATGTP